MTENYTLLTFCKCRFVKLAIVLFILFFTLVSKCFSQLTYTWNSTGTADWTAAANWTPARSLPLSNDILVFNNGATTTATNIPTETIGQLLINGGTTINLQTGIANNTLIISGITGGDDLVINAGSALNSNGSNALKILVTTGATGNINGDINFSNAPHTLDAEDVSGITFNSPANFMQDAGCSGYVFTNGGTSKAIVFNSGTAFLQKTGASPFALPQPASKVVFNKGSVFKPLSNTLLAFSGRTYANLEVNLATFNQARTGIALCTIDNIVMNHGLLSLDLTGGINITGSITVANGASLSFNSATNNFISFNGNTPQSISNYGNLSFGNNEAVVFNNATGITVNNDIVFNNAVTFTSGIVKMTNTAVLTLGASANVAGASNASFVDGPVKKIGNTGFVFPVGKYIFGFQAYVPIEISASGTNTDEYTAEYIRSSAVAVSSTYTSGLDHVSGVDYWSLNRTSGTGAIDVTLYWTNESSNGGTGQYINDITKLVVAHYDGATQWDAKGGVANGGSGWVSGSIKWTGINLFTPAINLFSLGSTDPNLNPLPINLNYLNGTKQNTNNYLKWQVTCGVSNSTAIMNLERSADGQNFTGITSVTADAIRCQQPFDYTDKQPLYGMNYYRLKMTDANGKVTYSSIIAILNKETGFDIISLMPTLVTNNAILNVTAAQKTKMDIVVTDITGKQVQKIAYNLIAGSNQFTMNLENLAAGTYQINGYTTDGKSRTLRFVKQ